MRISSKTYFHCPCLSGSPIFQLPLQTQVVFWHFPKKIVSRLMEKFDEVQMFMQFHKKPLSLSPLCSDFSYCVEKLLGHFPLIIA